MSRIAADDFNFTTAYFVRHVDLDYTGRLSQSAVLNVFQGVRIEYLGMLGGYTELDVGDGCGLIQSEATIHFYNDMHRGDALKVSVSASAVRGASFVMNYKIYKEDILMVEGKTTLLAFDYNIRKPRRLPAALKKAITEFESGT